MSQIRKLQSGGTPQKVGSLTIGGRRYEATPEMIQALTNYLAPSSKYTVNLAGLTSALANGADVTYDPIGNTIIGMSGSWSGVNQRGDDKRIKGADQDFNHALQYLSSFYYNAPDNRSEILGDKIFLDFDDEGQYLPSGANNSRIRQRYQQIGEHFADEKNSKYKLGKFGDANIDALRALYKDPSMVNSRFEDILKRAETGGRSAITAEDLAFLKAFNIIEGGDKEGNGSGVKGGAKQDKDKWTNAGYGKLWDLLKDKATLNDDGFLSLNEGETDWGLGDYGNGNYYFNDDFYRYAKNSQKYSPFKGLTLFENQLYTNQSSGLTDILSREDGYNETMQRGDFAGAQNIIKTNWKRGELFNPGVIKSDTYLPDFTSPSIRVNNVTGLQEIEGMQPRQQLIQTIDLSTPDVLEGDPYRQYTYKYSLLDENGKKIRDVDTSEVRDIVGGQSAGDIRAYKLLSGINPRSKYANRYYYDYVAAGDENGKESPLRAYISKSDPNDIIMQMDGLDDNVIIPKEIAQLLFSNPNFVNKLSNLDAQGMVNLKEFLRSLQDPSKRFFHTYLFDTEWWNDSNWNDVAKSLGLSKEEMLQLKQLVEKEKNQTNRYSISKPVIRSQKNGGVLKNQKGGVAGGSTQTKGVSERIVDTQKFYNPKNAAGITDAKIFGGDGKNWTSADTADMAALVGDLGSLVLAFTPGTNIASAGVGAAGSIARYKADKDRGTSGAGWNLALNLGMDAATLLPILGGGVKGIKVANAVRKSASTLIKLASFAGLGSAFVSTVNKIASGEKFTARDISTIVNGVTAGIGVIKSGGFGKGTKKNGGFEEISIKGKKGEGVDLSGQNVTIKKNDLGADFDGLSVADKQKRIADVALAQMRAKSGKTDLTTEQLAKAVENRIPTEWTGTDIVITGKRSANAGLADGDIKLTSKDIETITNSKNEKAELEKIIADKVRAKTRNTTMSDEDALKNVDLSQFSKQNWWRRKIIPGKGWMKKKDKFDFNPTEKEGTSAYTPEEIAKMNVFKRWWNGLGTNRMLYNRRMRGEGVFDLVPVPEKMPSWRDPKFRTVQRVLHEQYIPPTDSGNIITATNYPALNRTLFRNAQSEVRGRNREAMDQFGKLLKRYENTHVFVPQWVHWLTDANYQKNQYQTPAGFAPLYQPVYKKGGKILKGDSGTKTYEQLLQEAEFDEKQSALGNRDKIIETEHSELAPGTGLNWENGFGTNRSSVINYGKKLALQNEADKIFEDWDTEQDIKLQNDLNAQSNEIFKSLGINPVVQGTKPKSQTIANFNPVDLFNVVGAGVANRLANEQMNALRRYQENYLYGSPLQLNAPSYTTSGKGDAYRESARRVLDTTVPTTSDALKNYAMYKDRFGNYNKFMTQASLEDANDKREYTKALYDNSIQNQKLDYNWEMAKNDAKNKVNQVLATGESQLAAEKSAIINKLMASLSSSAEKAFLDRAADIAITKNAPNFDLWKRKSEVYNAMTAEQKASSDGIALKGEIDALESHMSDVSRAAQRSGIYHVKKGGKTKVEYSRDPFPELLIDDNKATHRFVEKLSVETLRMLSKIKPLHVS